MSLIPEDPKLNTRWNLIFWTIAVTLVLILWVVSKLYGVDHPVIWGPLIILNVWLATHNIISVIEKSQS